MEVYRADEDDLIRIPETEFQEEATLENHLIKADGAEIGGVKLLYIGRQGSPQEGGVFDILAVDENGDVVIVELKRGKSPRHIVSQALEYASGIRKESYDELNKRYREFVQTRSEEIEDHETRSLQEAHEDYFDLDFSISKREFNASQRLILVATEFDDVSLNMADFLREHSIDAICVEYEAYATENQELQLVTTDAIRRPLAEEPTGTASDDDPDYSELIFNVRDRIYPQLKDVLAVDSPDDLKRTGTKQFGFPSQDPEHPDPVRYGFKPELDDDGTATVRLNVWGGDSDAKARIRSLVADAIENLAGFELTEDYRNSWVLVKKELAEDDFDNEDEFEAAIATAMIELVEFFHPKFVADL